MNVRTLVAVVTLPEIVQILYSKKKKLVTTGNYEYCETEHWKGNPRGIPVGQEDR